MRSLVLCLTFACLIACGTAKPGGMSGPSMNNRLGTGDDPPPPALQSNDILSREQRGYNAKVKHILIGWKGHGDPERQDERAKTRNRAESETLVRQLLKQLEAGAPIEALMKEYSEDPGSVSGAAYDVEPGGSFVFEFRRLALRLDVGEVGVVLTDFGWHIMKRVE